MEIPLFPLRTVLFPGMELPLQVFEERYKTMTRELLETGGVFGVLLIQQGREVGGGAIPFKAGTTAAIEEWQELEGGRYRLRARGRQRFRIVEMLRPRPYPYGRIELVDESWEPSDLLNRSLRAVRDRFPEYFQLALALTDQWARGLRLPSEPHAVANFLAPWLQCDETDKQRLLEIEPAPERIEYLAELIDRLLQRTRAQVTDRRRQKYAGLGSGN